MNKHNNEPQVLKKLCNFLTK